MIRCIASSALLLLALAACAAEQSAQTPPTTRAAARPDTVTPAATAPAAPSAAAAYLAQHAVPDSVVAVEPPVAPLPPAPAYLVWTADSSHEASTAWIDGEGRVVAHRRGVYVADGARLWRWTQGRGGVRGLDCVCFRREQDHDTGKDCTYVDVMETAYLLEVGGTARIRVLDLPDSATSEGVDPGRQHAYPTTGAGPYLFNEWTFAGDGCGAHGWWGTMHQLSFVRLDSVMTTDTARYTVADSAAGMRKLVETDWDDDPEGVRGMSFHGVEAWFQADSALSLYLRYGTSAPFEESDEGGGHGRTEVVPAHFAPRWLAPYVRTPDAVRRYWRASPRREHAGWSAIDAPHAAVLLARFRGGDATR